MSSRLNQTLNRLQRGSFAATITRKSFQLSRGLEQEVEDTPVDIEVFTVPSGPNDWKLHERFGSQELDNRHFWIKGEDFEISNRDIITYDGTDYEIRMYEPRPHGGFVYAFGTSVKRSVHV